MQTQSKRYVCAHLGSPIERRINSDEKDWSGSSTALHCKIVKLQIWNTVALKKRTLDEDSFNKILKLVAILQKFGSFTKTHKLMGCAIPLPRFDDDRLIALR